MNRFAAVISSCLLLLGVWVTAAAQSRLAFEVVSIKPVPRPTPETIQAGTSRLAFNIDGARVEIAGFGLVPIVARAFGVEVRQVDMRGQGGDQTFEIQAKLPAGATPEQVPEMLQDMLVERFKLAYHRETREYEMTVLTIAKNGMKLTRLPEGTKPTSSSVRHSDGSTRFTQTSNVAALFPVMNSFGGFRQMVDETGLDGMYTWVRDLPPPSPGIDYQEATQESFRVMLEAAGLKLDERKISKETIVVDHSEAAPTAN